MGMLFDVVKGRRIFIVHFVQKFISRFLFVPYIFTQLGLFVLVPTPIVAASPNQVREEIISKRTGHSKTFSLGVNEYGHEEFEIISFADKVHYQTPKGWMEVDNNIIDFDYGGFAYKNAANDFVFRAGIELETGVQFSRNGEICEFVLDSIQGVEPENSIAIVNKNHITYPNIYPDADLEFTVHSTGIVTEIVAKSSSALRSEISFALTNCHPDTFDQAVMTDADSGAEVQEKLVQETDGIKLILEPDYSQLGEINGEVRIDPSISNSVSADTFVSPSTGANGGRRFMAIGTYYDPTVNATFSTSRALVDFGTLNLPDNAILSNAEIQLYHYGTNGGNQAIQVARITGAWDESTIWPGPSFDGDFGGSIFPYYNNNSTAILREIPIDLSLVDFLNTPNNGIMLKYADETKPGVVVCSRETPSGPCHEGMEPRIVVRYAESNPPEIPTLDYPNEGWELGANETYDSVICDTSGIGNGCEVDFRVKAEDPDDNFPLRTEVKIRSDEGENSDFTYFQSENGWFIQSIHINDGHWHWKARVMDGDGGWSDWSSIKNFIIDTTSPTVPLMNHKGEYTQGYFSNVSTSGSVDALIGVPRYEFQISDNSDFSTYKTSGWGLKSHKFTGLKHNTKYYYRVRSQDKLGNISAWSPVITSVQDGRGPYFAYVSLSNNVISPRNQDGKFDTTNISFSVVEDHWKSTYVRILNRHRVVVRTYSGLGQQVNLEIDGKDSNGEWLADGFYQIQLIAHDLAGNISTISPDNTKLVIDNTPSALNISYPADGAWFNSAIVEINGIANPSAVVTFINFATAETSDVDADSQTGIFSEEIGIVGGENSIQVVAEDEYANKTQEVTTVYRENAIPEVELLSPNDISNAQKPVIRFNLTDIGENGYVSGVNIETAHLSLFNSEGGEIVLVNEGVNVSGFGHVENDCTGIGTYGLSRVPSCNYSYVFNKKLQPDDTYLIHSKFCDVAGNCRTDEDWSFTIDSQTFLSVAQPQNGTLFNHSLVTLHGSAEENAIVKIIGNADNLEFVMNDSESSPLVIDGHEIVVNNCRYGEEGIEICDWEVTKFQLEGDSAEDREVINSVQYSITDSAGNTLSVEQTYTVNLFAVDLEIGTDINYFSPNGDGRHDGIDFLNLSTNGIVDIWEIRIKNNEGELIRILDGSSALPANVFWNGKYDADDLYADGLEYVLSGDYSYYLYLKTTDGVEFQTLPISIFARTELNDSVVISYPQNNAVTTRGVTNVQGQAPRDTTVRICVDTIGLDATCDFEYYSEVDDYGSFSSVVPLIRLEGQAQTEHFITARAVDQFGNSTENSNRVRVVVDTRDPFVSVAALPALTGVNNEEDYQFIVDKLNNNEEVTQEDLDRLRTVILRSTVTQNTEYVQLSYADFTNLDELPENFDYSKLGYIDGENETRFGLSQSSGEASVCNSPECTWDFYYPVPPVTGGIYDIEFTGKKGESVEKLSTPLMIDGTIPLAPIVLDINKFVDEQVFDTNLFQDKYYSNSEFIEIVGGADPNTEIQIYDQHNTLICSTVTNAIGLFSCSANIAEFYPSITESVFEIQLLVEASDGLNKTESLEETVLVIDKIVPDILQIQSNNQWKQSGTVTEVSVVADEMVDFVQFTTPEYSQIEFSFADDFKSGVGTLIIPGTAQEGEYPVQIMVRDIAGNEGVTKYNFYIDNTKPGEPSIDTDTWVGSGVDYTPGVPAQGRLVPEYVTSDNILDIYGWGEENSTLDFYLDGETVGSIKVGDNENAECIEVGDSIIQNGVMVKSEYQCKWVYELSLTQEKGFMLTTKIRDRAGNESLVSDDVVLYLDQTAPNPAVLLAGTADLLSGDKMTDQEFIILDTESERLSDIEYWVFDSSGAEVDYVSAQNDKYGIRNQELNLNGEDGIFTIRISLTDAAGNKSDDLKFEITKNTNVGSVTISNPETSPDILGVTTTSTDGIGVGAGESNIAGAEIGNEYAGRMGCNVVPINLNITLWPDGGYSMDYADIEPPFLTLVDSVDGTVSVYGTALPKSHKINAEVTKMAMTYSEAKSFCDVAFWKVPVLMNTDERNCIENGMNIENLALWYSSRNTVCSLLGPFNVLCMSRKLNNDRADSRIENYEFSVDNVMVSFHKGDGSYIGHLWNDDWTGRFTKVFSAGELKPGDKVKARVNIFGSFDINWITVDYSGDDGGGVQSKFGNTLTVGEQNENSDFIYSADSDPMCPGVHNSDKRYTVGTAATLIADILAKSSSGYQYYSKFKCADPHCAYIPQKVKDIYKLAGSVWNPDVYPNDYVQCIAFVYMAYNLADNPIRKVRGNAIAFAGKEWKCDNFNENGGCATDWYLVNNNVYADQFTVYESGVSTEMPQVGDVMVWKESAPWGHVGVVVKVDTVRKTITLTNANSKRVTWKFDYTKEDSKITILGNYWKPDYWARKK